MHGQQNIKKKKLYVCVAKGNAKQVTLQRNTKLNSWQDLTMHILQNEREQTHNFLLKTGINLSLSLHRAFCSLFK